MHVFLGTVLLALCCYTHVTPQRITRHVSEHGRLNQVTIDSLNHVFVGGTNTILQFADESLNPEDLINKLFTNCGNVSRVLGTCNHTTTNNDWSVFQLFHHARIEDTNVQLLACGTWNQGQCFIFDVQNISIFWPIVSPDAHVPEQARLGSVTSAVVVQAHGDFLFSAISDTGMDPSSEIYTFSERWFHTVNDTTYYMYYKMRDSDIYIGSKPGTRFSFISSFLYNDFVYFLRNTLSDNNPEAFLSQTCIIDDYFRSYIETRLQCGRYVIAETAVVFNITDKTYLFVAFRSQLHPGSALCVYDVETIQARFKQIHRDCFKEKLGSWPPWVKQNGTACGVIYRNKKTECGWTSYNARILAAHSLKQMNPLYVNTSYGAVMTSLAFLDAGDMAIGYIGHSDGSLVKMLLDDKLSHHHRLYTVNIATNQSIDPNMVMNAAGDKLFYTYSNTVAMMRLDDCSLLPTCQACLADMTSCAWTGTCVSFSDVKSDVKVYSENCPPIIMEVRPLSGPPEGGTVITVIGDLGKPGDHVTVQLGSKAVLNTTLGYGGKISFTTPAAEDGTNSAIIKVTVTAVSGYTELPWDIVTNGTSRYRLPFKFKKPALDLNNDTITHVIESGMVELRFSGDNLDVGSNRSLIIGTKPCLHIRTTNTSLSCMAPAQSSHGNFSSVLSIDRARIPGPTLTYIHDPVITQVQPRRVILSGGVPVTITGTRLYGLGHGVYLTLGNKQGKHTTPCESRDDRLVCIAEPQTLFQDPPYAVSFGLANTYGSLNAALSFLKAELNQVTMVQDPIIPETSTRYLGISNISSITLQGQMLNHVTERDIRITVGNVPCSLKLKTDTNLNCDVTFTRQTPEHQMIDIQVQIGTNLQFRAGTAVRGRPEKIQHSKQPESPSYTTYFVLGLSLLVIISVIALITLRRRRKLTRARSIPYNVTFRREQEPTAESEMMSSEGTEGLAIQNVYQPMLRTTEVRGAESKDQHTPLLSDIDPDLKLSLDRQGLLVNPDMLVLGETIGQGHFGCVYKGYLHKVGEKGETIVAAKTLHHRGHTTEINVDRFLKEALIMKDFHHRNVMELMGICVGMESLPLVVLPYMTRGDVLSYIRDVNNVPTVKKLVEFGIDIANGMYYLSQLKFVHRDLAARNCMIDDDLTVKVADFGLSRDVYEKEYYSSCDKKTMLPVKWMSPESLEFGLFSYKTDIWSYGIVLWELLTRGMNPYPAVDNWDVLRYLKSGRRLNKPDYCPEGMYKIMQHCWSWEPDDRPSFGDLTVEIPLLLRRLDRISRSSSTEETK